MYDVRVCDELQVYHGLADVTDFERVWEGYTAYMRAVQSAVSNGLSLRDKDRWLWGRSAAEQLKKDVAAGFKTAD